MKVYESLEAYEAAVRRGEVAVKRGPPAAFDVEAYLRKIDDERRAFRRARRLDLKWAGFFYACAVYCGAITATFDQWGISIFGLAFAAVGAAVLDAGLRDLFGEGEK